MQAEDERVLSSPCDSPVMSLLAQPTLSDIREECPFWDCLDDDSIAFETSSSASTDSGDDLAAEDLHASETSFSSESTQGDSLALYGSSSTESCYESSDESFWSDDYDYGPTTLETTTGVLCQDLFTCAGEVPSVAIPKWNRRRAPPRPGWKMPIADACHPGCDPKLKRRSDCARPTWECSNPEQVSLQ